MDLSLPRKSVKSVASGEKNSEPPSVEGDSFVSTKPKRKEEAKASLLPVVLGAGGSVLALAGVAWWLFREGGLLHKRAAGANVGTSATASAGGTLATELNVTAEIEKGLQVVKTVAPTSAFPTSDHVKDYHLTYVLKAVLKDEQVNAQETLPSSLHQRLEALAKMPAGNSLDDANKQLLDSVLHSITQRVFGKVDNLPTLTYDRHFYLAALAGVYERYDLLPQRNLMVRIITQDDWRHTYQQVLDGKDVAHSSQYTSDSLRKYCEQVKNSPSYKQFQEDLALVAPSVFHFDWGIEEDLKQWTLHSFEGQQKALEFESLIANIATQVRSKQTPNCMVILGDDVVDETLLKPLKEFLIDLKGSPINTSTSHNADLALQAAELSSSADGSNLGTCSSSGFVSPETKQRIDHYLKLLEIPAEKRWRYIYRYNDKVRGAETFRAYVDAFESAERLLESLNINVKDPIKTIKDHIQDALSEIKSNQKWSDFEAALQSQINLTVDDFEQMSKDDFLKIYRKAIRRLHPDTGGSEEAFKKYQPLLDVAKWYKEQQAKQM